jgi:predicted site-specific integrase-resolvase
MGKRISSQMRKQLLKAASRRYRESSKTDKTWILDEFGSLVNYHRKHVVRLLSQMCNTEAQTVRGGHVGSQEIVSIVLSTETVLQFSGFL